MIKILIADDHPVVRQGLRHVIGGHPDWQWIGDASNGIEALQQIARLHPDVVLLDLDMPLTSGMDVLRLLQREPFSPKVLALSAATETEQAAEAIRLGAHGYLDKAARLTDFALAIQTVMRGDLYVSSELARSLDLSAQRASDGSPLQSLSARERQVLRLVVNGYSSQKIADLLSLSPKTVDTYRSRLMLKLGADDLPALVRLAIREGIVGSS